MGPDVPAPKQVDLQSTCNGLEGASRRPHSLLVDHIKLGVRIPFWLKQCAFGTAISYIPLN
ncbi:hypothetical protein VTI28DRAFT_7241 [Corynascus sepedonium]